MRWLNRAHVYDGLKWSNMTIIARIVRVKHLVVFIKDGTE